MAFLAINLANRLAGMLISNNIAVAIAALNNFVMNRFFNKVFMAIEAIDFLRR